ncbi:MAG: SAM-dependent DNA methyltransferase [Deltaproteobacteria bacterium]|nr:SAM-dependent DNA methyltransferase [Deltaproteobacteria bacterium]
MVITPAAPTPSHASAGRRFQTFQEASNFLWSIADLLRGEFKAYDFGKVILPFTVLRRLDCVLAATKDQVLAEVKKLKGGRTKNTDLILQAITGVRFHNTSKLDCKRLLDDPSHLAENINAYVNGFSADVREIFVERFQLPVHVAKLDEANLLYKVVKEFVGVDLHPSAMPNHMMGLVFEDLIRRFAEQSNETAGEHYTPREVIRLMVNLLFVEDADILAKKGVVRKLYDPACGTGGMLSVAEEYLYELNKHAHLEVYGQELNDESYAICKADMLVKAENPGHIARGNSFSDDGHKGEQFDYLLSNPPFGVEWKKVVEVVETEHETMGMAGRFGAGLPRINDGSFLFLQHMISKMKAPSEGGSRIAIVFNGSPLFTGDAGSGESEIRRWIIENDWLEAIVGLPDQLFFNTGISTYVWIVTNRKAPERQGKIQLIDATAKFAKMRKSLGNKRHYLTEEHIREITEVYGDFVENDISKVFAGDDFGYWKITVERPLRLAFTPTPERVARVKEVAGFANLARSKKKGEAARAEVEAGQKLQTDILAALATLDGSKTWKRRAEFEGVVAAALKQAGVKLPTMLFDAVVAAIGERDETAEVCTDDKGKPEPDPELRDTENVPLTDDIHAYFKREVLPHVPDAWIDESVTKGESKTKKGYEIPFTRHFYRYTPLRSLDVIEAEVRELEAEIQGMLGGVVR